MKPKKLEALDSFTATAPWDPTHAPFEREGTVSVGGGPPAPARLSGQHVERKRLRVFDINFPRLFWLTVFWRGWANGGKPALEVSLWRPNRRGWLHVWQWEAEPTKIAMEAIVQPTSQHPETAAATATYCDYCGWMRQADIRGECPQCGRVHVD